MIGQHASSTSISQDISVPTAWRTSGETSFINSAGSTRAGRSSSRRANPMSWRTRPAARHLDFELVVEALQHFGGAPLLSYVAGDGEKAFGPAAARIQNRCDLYVPPSLGTFKSRQESGDTRTLTSTRIVEQAPKLGLYI